MPYSSASSSRSSSTDSLYTPNAPPRGRPAATAQSPPVQRRTTFSNHELRYLNATWDVEYYPSTATVNRIIDATGLTLLQVRACEHQRTVDHALPSTLTRVIASQKYS
ncbi:hypothetical protein RQP46_010949 [Phenoliferia psychrophenolica]